MPVQVSALRDAYASGAAQLVHGYFEKRRQDLHFEFVVEDIQTHKAIQTLAADGEMLPALDRLAKQIDAGAHPFSSTNPQAVAAWAHGEYENAVTLDPDFGAAWLSWAQARSAAADNPQAKQQASEIAARALRQSSLRSPVDRAQLEFMSATLRQDEPAQQRALRELARLMPHDLSLLRQLATREMNARRFPEAEKYYQAMLQESPDDIEIWNLLGYAQAFAGDVDVGAKVVRALRARPGPGCQRAGLPGGSFVFEWKIRGRGKVLSGSPRQKQRLARAAATCSRPPTPGGCRATWREPINCLPGM